MNSHISQNADMQSLNLSDFPLDKHALIEASAGTGKTYAVANLYLRYLLDRRLDVSQILVVTFTEAATQELKDRIRARIKELVGVFRGRDTDDQLLKSLFANSKAPEEDVLWLTLAERNIDQAQIYTIHGFCQQILTKHAIEIGLPLNQTLLEDEGELLQEMTEDFWRSSVLRMPEDIIAEISALWAGPMDLALSVSLILSRRAEKIYPAPFSGLDAWLASISQAKQWYATLHQEILKSQADMSEILQGAELKRLKDKLSWWDKILEWANKGEYGAFPAAGKRKNLLLEFTPGALQEQTKAKGQTPEHDLFYFIERHMQSIPVPFKESFIVQAASDLRQRLEQHKRSQSIVSFDDLIHLLARVFKAENHDITGRARAETLYESLRSRFRVGLIDEFQDTDNDQYSIFSRIFMPYEQDIAAVRSKEEQSPARARVHGCPNKSANESTNESKRYSDANALVLIGDPKQAIYSFRGGDISTYLRAKEDIRKHSQGDIYTMDTNWRSAEEMVAAVNYMFAENDRVFLAEDIPFVPVKASKPLFDGSTCAIQVECLSHDKLNKDSINRILAEKCVFQVLSCLEKSGVENHDIAILVRSANEAELIKATLATHNLAASYEGKTSIFDSDEALALSLLLEAIAQPRNEYLMMRCLSSLFFGQPDTLLEEIQLDDRALNEALGRFEHLHEVWKQHGVLAMVRQFLHEFELYCYWHHSQGQQNDWERRLTNLNQLAEILQKQSRTTKGMLPLVRWLNEHIYIRTFTEDEGKVRLESDEQLIRIVTIHKSKGLEYPYVFLPFLYSARGASESWFYDESGALCLDLLQQEKFRVAVEQERLAEDVRLLYVALTRAKYRCFIGTAYYKGIQNSLGVEKTAWSRLVYRGAAVKIDQEEYIESLRLISDRSEGLIGLNVFDENEKLSSRFEERNRIVEDRTDTDASTSVNRSITPRFLDHTLSRYWKVHSFTGLMKENEMRLIQSSLGQDHAGQKNSEDTLQGLQRLQGDVLIEREDCSEDRTGGELSEFSISISDFPKGSRAGTFLHELFEDIEFATNKPRDRALAGTENLIEFKLKKSGLIGESDVTLWTRYLSEWIKQALQTRLFNEIQLSQLVESRYEPELEFYFPVESLSPAKLGKLLSQYGYAPISFDVFRGHLKGAIDLVFESEDQYYVLDYKSNYLGEQISSYSQEAMKQAMDEHRYDIQYLIYTLAFHRFLSHRKGSRYDYERDFGGVLYVFLRGLDLAREDANQNRGFRSGVYFIKPDTSLIKALDALVGSCGI